MALPTPTGKVQKIADRTGVTASNDGSDGPRTAHLVLDGAPGFYNAVLQATETVNGTSTFDVVIEDGLTESGPWFTWISFTQLAGVSGNELKTATRDPLPFVRVTDTVGAGASTYAYTVHLSRRRKEL